MHQFLEKLMRGAEVEWRTFGELCTPIRAEGKVKRTQYRSEGRTPIVDQGARFIAGYTDEGLPTVPPGKHIIFGDHSEIVKFVDFEFVQGADGLKILSPHGVNAKYAYYAFCSRYVPRGGYKRHWTLAQNTPLPIPPPAVQERIVEILDAFTSLAAALEAEMHARQLQYQHYTDRLFTEIAGETAPLGDLGTFTRGYGLQKKDFAPEGIGCIHYGQVYTHYGVHTDTTISHVSEEFAQKARKAKCGDLVIASTSENDEDLCKAVAWLGEEDIAISSDACIYSHGLSPKYVSYFFRTADFNRQKRRYISGSKVKRVHPKDLAKICIPLPPLEVQEQVVGILDRFNTLCTSSTDGLPHELALRRQQYEYYRDILLGFERE